MSYCRRRQVLWQHQPFLISHQHVMTRSLSDVCTGVMDDVMRNPSYLNIYRRVKLPTTISIRHRGRSKAQVA